MADTPIPDTQEFEIQYAGGLANQNSIPLDDLIESLRGFENFFSLTDSIFIQGRLTRRALPPEYRIEIRVRRIAPGSIIAVLVFVGQLAAAGIIGGASWDFLKKLWQWRVSVLKSRTKPVRLPWSIEENVAALEAMAREADIKPSDDEEDPVEILQDLNATLSNALAPIAHSVETITVASKEAEVNVSLGRPEKFAVESQPVTGYTSVDNSDWEQAKISFVRIHTGTGHALIKFIQPKADDKKGTKPCTIVDPAFKRPNDPFTRAMSRRAAINAWVRKAILDAEKGAFRWELRATPPTPEIGLFERMPRPTHPPINPRPITSSINKRQKRPGKRK